MQLNKNIIKIVGTSLIFIVVFMFSVVLATDESIYVWSSETEKIEQTSASLENNIANTNSLSDTKNINENNTKQTNVEKVKENTNLNLESGGAILIEQKTGNILYDHNAHEKLRPASVTKVMSILLIMEALDSGQIALTDKVPCTEDAAGMGGSQIWLEVGEELTVDEMLKAICVVSANDCTVQF